MYILDIFRVYVLMQLMQMSNDPIFRLLAPYSQRIHCFLISAFTVMHYLHVVTEIVYALPVPILFWFLHRMVLHFKNLYCENISV